MSIFIISDLWKNIPYDIIDVILEYDGRIKKRNGIYMNQLLKNDYRYNIIRYLSPKKTYILGSSSDENIETYVIHVTLKKGFVTKLLVYMLFENKNSFKNELTYRWYSNDIKKYELICS